MKSKILCYNKMDIECGWVSRHFGNELGKVDVTLKFDKYLIIYHFYGNLQHLFVRPFG
jgi:hypothetical protein